MSPALWHAPSEDDDQTSIERQRPILVSLHFIRAALHRRRLVCVLSPLLGLLLAAAYMAAFPPAHAAKASLVLEYDSQTDPLRAMATNVSLLKTETLATRTVTSLGLTMTPDDFLKTVTIEPVGSELLSLTLTAPDDTEATRRLAGLTSIYLDFRAEQLSYQSKVLVDGYQERITQLQKSVRGLSGQIERSSATSGSDASKLSDLIAQRASIQSRIEALEQSVEDDTLRNSAVVAASRVLDPPTPVPGLAKRTLALGLASGLIGGTALGWGTVLFLAITSDRLRRRSDVANVLGVDVRVSVGRIAPLGRAWKWLPPLHALDQRRADSCGRLSHALEEELMLPEHRRCLAVAGIDSAGVVGYAVAEAAHSLVRQGHSVTVIDLTERGSRGLRDLRDPLRRSGTDAPVVLRSRGVPALARRTEDLLAFGTWDADENEPPPQLSDCTLILADLDPAVGASHLPSWTDRVVVVLTAGHSSVEKARTIGDQVRDAGLDLRFAALLGTESTDHSSGTVRLTTPASVLPAEELAAPETVGRFEVR